MCVLTLLKTNMPYTKTELNKFLKGQVVGLYIVDQKKWIEESKENHSLKQQIQKMKDNWDKREHRLAELHEEKLSIKKELTDENTQHRMDIDKLKDELHLCKASHKRLTEEINHLKQKEEKRDKLITDLYDSL